MLHTFYTSNVPGYPVLNLTIVLNTNLRNFNDKHYLSEQATGYIIFYLNKTL